jgi:hypothetical protein
MAWPVVVVVGLVAGWWLWQHWYSTPYLGGPIGGAEPWEARCWFGGGDPRPHSKSFTRLPAPELANARRYEGKGLVGVRLRVLVTALDARRVPGVDLADWVEVVGTVERLRKGQVWLRGCVLVSVCHPDGSAKGTGVQP